MIQVCRAPDNQLLQDRTCHVGADCWVFSLSPTYIPLPPIQIFLHITDSATGNTICRKTYQYCCNTWSKQDERDVLDRQGTLLWVGKTWSHLSEIAFFINEIVSSEWPTLLIVLSAWAFKLLRPVHVRSNRQRMTSKVESQSWKELFLYLKDFLERQFQKNKD